MTKRIVIRNNWLGLLGIIFVLCKIFQFSTVATWSWWLVLLPFYWHIALSLSVMLFMAGSALIVGIAAGILVVYEHVDGKIRGYFRRKREFKARVWKDIGGKD